MPINQKNYDPSTFLCWFRKLDQHTDPEMHLLAEAFCKQIASSLGMQTPAIFWFEDADFRQAREAWLNSQARGIDQTTDPLLQPCEYFRWHGRPGLGFAGYAHRESPKGVMINVCRRGKDLLETVTEECFHLYQDIIHGAGWRTKTDENTVEGEAAEFVRLRAGEIQAFLEYWDRRTPHRFPRPVPPQPPPHI